MANVAGLSTIGVLVGYATESTAGTRPTAGFTKLNRINAVGGISLDVEQIDASALEDSVTKYIAGRADTGSDFSITVNYTNETAAEWATLFTAAQTAKNASKATWIEIYHPSLTNAFFVSVELPSKLPVPEMGQNELLTVEIGCTVVDFETGTAVAPTDPS